MILNRLYQKYFLLAFVLLCFFVLLGFFFSSFMMRTIMSGQEFKPPVFFAHVVDRLNSEDKVEALKELSSWQISFPAPRLTLFNENGDVLYPQMDQNILNWGDIVKPKTPYEFVNVISKNQKHMMSAFGPPPPPVSEALVRLRGTPVYYLLISPPERPKKKGMAFFPLIGIGSLLLSLLLGVGTTIAIVYNHVRKGVVQADSVIKELQEGNLKARFDVRRKGEFGEAMIRFNFMADEIEKLVLDLKAVDQSRTLFFQEVAHDLRTPIASLKNLMETLYSKRDKLEMDVQNELTELALKEIEYFERLVEDLLFIAQAKKPPGQSEYPLIKIADLLSEAVDSFSVRSQYSDRKVEVQQNLGDRSLEIHGDAHLIKRLIRNALENAFAFANATVSISMQRYKEDKIEIIIEDDGAGFSAEDLESFGSQRITRKLESKRNSRLSVGLGSVVMKTVCDAHKGKLEASNRKNGKSTLGAQIIITLPIRNVPG